MSVIYIYKKKLKNIHIRESIIIINSLLRMEKLCLYCDKVQGRNAIRCPICQIFLKNKKAEQAERESIEKAEQQAREKVEMEAREKAERERIEENKPENLYKKLSPYFGNPINKPEEINPMLQHIASLQSSMNKGKSRVGPDFGWVYSVSENGNGSFEEYAQRLCRLDIIRIDPNKRGHCFGSKPSYDSVSQLIRIHPSSKDNGILFLVWPDPIDVYSMDAISKLNPRYIFWIGKSNVTDAESDFSKFYHKSCSDKGRYHITKSSSPDNRYIMCLFERRCDAGPEETAEEKADNNDILFAKIKKYSDPFQILMEMSYNIRSDHHMVCNKIKNGESTPDEISKFKELVASFYRLIYDYILGLQLLDNNKVVYNKFLEENLRIFRHSREFREKDRDPFSFSIDINIDTNTILGMGRSIFIAQYSWAIPTKKAIEEITKFVDGDTVLETGAGSGIWAYLLQNAGVKVMATDSGNEPFRKCYTEIEKLDAKEAVSKYHNANALFMCWSRVGPPRSFTGNKYIYIGEPGYDGCTKGWPADKHWECVNEIEIPNWYEIHDRVYLFHRKMV